MVTWLARRSFDLKVKPLLEPVVGRHVVQAPYTPSCMLNGPENIVLEWTNIPSTEEHPTTSYFISRKPEIRVVWSTWLVKRFYLRLKGLSHWDFELFLVITMPQYI